MTLRLEYIILIAALLLGVGLFAADSSFAGDRLDFSGDFKHLEREAKRQKIRQRKELLLFIMRAQAHRKEELRSRSRALAQMKGELAKIKTTKPKDISETYYIEERNELLADEIEDAKQSLVELGAEIALLRQLIRNPNPGFIEKKRRYLQKSKSGFERAISKGRNTVQNEKKLARTAAKLAVIKEIQTIPYGQTYGSDVAATASEATRVSARKSKRKVKRAQKPRRQKRRYPQSKEQYVENFFEFSTEDAEGAI